jgi:hypothetical protein
MKILRLVHGRFLPNPFRFIIDLPFATQCSGDIISLKKPQKRYKRGVSVHDIKKFVYCKGI